MLPDILFGMSPTPACPGPVRPLAEINDAIRDCVMRGHADSEEYQLLLEEWAAAIRAAVTPAA